jgi:hypothetical protein
MCTSAVPSVVLTVPPGIPSYIDPSQDFHGIQEVQLSATAADNPAQGVQPTSSLQMTIGLTFGQLSGLNSSLMRLYAIEADGTWRTIPSRTVPASGGSTVLVSEPRALDATVSASGGYTLTAGISELTDYVIAAPGAGVLVPQVFLSSLSVPLPQPVQNGGFESDLQGWQTGGSLVSPQVTTSDSHTGSHSLLLGNPSLDGHCEHAGPGNSWISQTITVPNTANPTLTFAYHIHTQDYEPNPYSAKYDIFGVYHDSVNNANLLYADANVSVNTTNSPSCDAAKQDLGWQTPASRQGKTISLSQWAGKKVTLYFAVTLQPDSVFNTYTYLDDVAVSP